MLMGVQTTQNEEDYFSFFLQCFGLWVLPDGGTEAGLSSF